MDFLFSCGWTRSAPNGLLKLCYINSHNESMNENMLYNGHYHEKHSIYFIVEFLHCQTIEQCTMLDADDRSGGRVSHMR